MRWRRAVPADFAYAVKLNHFITHIKRLGVDAPTIARSYDTVAGLGPRPSWSSFRRSSHSIPAGSNSSAPRSHAVAAVTRSSRATRPG